MNPQLKQRRYLPLNGLISADLAEVFSAYARAEEKYRFQGADPQAPGTHSAYGDFFAEALLDCLTPKVEEVAGVKLFPTYSFYRVYRPGDELKVHKDRPACQVSVSVCLGYDYQGKDYKWRLVMGKEKVNLKPGDGVVYLGCEIEHARPPMLAPEGSWHTQAFLHYVDQDGPHADQRFDRRTELYAPMRR